MRDAIGDIIELIGPDCAVGFAFGQLLGQTPGKTHIIIRIAIRRGRNLNQFSTKKTQGILLFLALGFRNNNNGAIAKRLGNKSKADAGVSCCTFNDNAAGLEQSAFFGITDDVKRCAVLDRLSGIEKFGFAIDFATSE